MLRLLWRTLLILATAGIVMGTIYVPVRLLPSRNQERRLPIPGQPGRRTGERQRARGAFLSNFPVLILQLVIIGLIAVIGRKLFHLSLKR